MNSMSTGYHIDMAMALFVGLLSLVWGVVWAVLLQFTRVGRFLAARRTWFTVIIGIGVDLLILALVLPLELWLMVVIVIALSSVGIVARSLYNELRDVEDILRAVKDTSSE